MHLGDLAVGSNGLIVKVNSGEPLYRQRLLALGLLPGTPFKVTRIAPLGDPIEIIVKGAALILRKAEARILDVKEVF